MNPKLDLIFARRSIRTFADRPVADEAIQDLLEAAMSAPSACAKDPWHFVVVRNKNTLEQIAEGLPYGKMLPSAGAGIAVCGSLKKVHAGELSYLLQDCSAAIENVLIAAYTLGLGTCWLGVHPREDRIAHLRRVLSIPEEILPLSLIAVGWPAEEKQPRTRFSKEAVHFEAW